MNRVIKFLMISDILMLTSFGLIEPILAIFFKENLIGGSILTAGVASMIFLTTKSFVQLPFSRKVDKFDYRHRVRWLIIGAFLISTIPFIYILAKHIHIIYIAQIIYGLGAGLTYPTWLGLWSTHLDKNKESFEWSLYSTFGGIGAAFTAAGGAALAQYVGFNFTFILVGLISLTGTIILFSLDRKKHKIEYILGLQYNKRRKLLKNNVNKI